MSKLKSLKNTELSDYCINILAKHDMHLVVDFVHENPDKLMKILNLKAEQVAKIKAELKRIYGPIHKSFDDVEEEFYYTTHIGVLDHLLGRHTLTSQSVWEICGPSGVGKTQLAFTLLANFVQLHHYEALFIDTKLDFSARRLKNILNSRQLKPEVVAGCMQAIKVERVLSAKAVVEMLEALCNELQTNSRSHIKMIIIDSLPAVWFLLKADSNRLAGRWLLTRLANLIYKLAKEHQICIICVNLSIIPREDQPHQEGQYTMMTNEDVDEINKTLALDEENNDDNGEVVNTSTCYRQVMGQFWSAKPQIRLSVEFVSGQQQELRSPRRLIKWLRNSRLSSNELSCNVRICQQGMV